MTELHIVSLSRLVDVFPDDPAHGGDVDAVRLRQLSLERAIAVPLGDLSALLSRQADLLLTQERGARGVLGGPDLQLRDAQQLGQLRARVR